MNATLAYLDNSRPSKLVDIQSKLRDGDAWMAEGLRKINQRRVVYGLQPIKL